MRCKLSDLSWRPYHCCDIPHLLYEVFFLDRLILKQNQLFSIPAVIYHIRCKECFSCSPNSSEAEFHEMLVKFSQLARFSVDGHQV